MGIGLSGSTPEIPNYWSEKAKKGVLALLDTHEVELALERASSNLDLLWRLVNELYNEGWGSTVQKWLRNNPETAEKLRSGKGSPCDTPNVTTPAVAELAT
jgi:hypothetical protein